MNKQPTPYTIDDYLSLIKKEPSEENTLALWRAVFTRQAWFLLPAKRGLTTPLVFSTPEETTLPVFTSFRKLNHFAKKYNLQNSDHSTETLALSPYDALSKINLFAQYITIVAFNMEDKMCFKITPDGLNQYANKFNVFDFPSRSN